MTERQAFPHATVLMLGLAVLLNYVDRANLAMAAPLVQDELSLSGAQIGVLLSAFFWVYAPAQVLAGWLVHRFDIRIVLGAGVALWAARHAGDRVCKRVRLTPSPAPDARPRGERHLSQLAIDPRATHRRGRSRPANGFIGAGQGVGPMLGTLFGGLAMVQFGWRAMFIGLGLITFLWLWPWFVVTHRRCTSTLPPSTTRRQCSYLAILSRREFWGRHSATSASTTPSISS